MRPKKLKKNYVHLLLSYEPCGGRNPQFVNHCIKLQAINKLQLKLWSNNRTAGSTNKIVGIKI
jgi:hypothetical protein